MSDAPLRFHNHSHFHAEDRPKGIWRKHRHRHPHTALDMAQHDEVTGAGRDVGHGHAHDQSHPFGQLLAIDEGRDSWTPPKVRALYGRAPKESEKLARYEEMAKSGDPDVRAGYTALAADLKKAVLLDADEAPVRAKLSQADLIKAAVEDAVRKSPLSADLDRLGRRISALTKTLGIDRPAAPVPFMGKRALVPAPCPEADKYETQARAWELTNPDISQGYRALAHQARLSAAKQEKT